MPITNTTLAEDRLDGTFAALANSTRRAIFARLADGESSVNDLAAPFDLTLPAISKHIKVLENARTHHTRPTSTVPAMHDRPASARQRRRTGPTSTDTSGSAGSIVSTSTSADLQKQQTRRAHRP